MSGYRIRKIRMDLIAPHGTTDDRPVIRRYLSVCITIFIPVAVIFSILNIFHARYETAALILGIVMLLTIQSTRLRTSPIHHRSTPRFFIGSITFLFFYELYSGGGDGAAFMWFLVLPASTMFLLGTKEGTCWSIGNILLLSLIFISGIGFTYKFNLYIRFLTIYIILTLLAASLEILRQRYLHQLRKEKTELQQALDEIKILKRMIPICSSCKKIRDDKGFWMQIESYMKAHTDMEFSHGICPECASKHFPSTGKPKTGHTDNTTSGELLPDGGSNSLLLD